jgi:GGDEF domain-containing protein
VVDGKRLVLLLTDTPSSGAVIVATRLGAGVRALNQPDQAPPLTVSIGVAELEPDFAAAQALYERALDRMRAALAAGGDRVVARD